LLAHAVTRHVRFPRISIDVEPHLHDAEPLPTMHLTSIERTVPDYRPMLNDPGSSFIAGLASAVTLDCKRRQSIARAAHDSETRRPPLLPQLPSRGPRPGRNSRSLSDSMRAR